MPSRCLATRYASLRVPQCSVFSIFAPFSAQVCSMPEITFLISSSGVAGRAMKIRSYKRSSMMTSFLFAPMVSAALQNLLRIKTSKTVLLFFRFFRFRQLSPVENVHGRLNSLCENHFDGIASFSNHLRRLFKLGPFHRPQHEFFAAAQRM